MVDKYSKPKDTKRNTEVETNALVGLKLRKTFDIMENYSVQIWDQYNRINF
jgi:hypothetical protein